MSIKRSKQRSFSRRPGGDDTDFGFLQSSGPEKTWEERIKDQADDAFAPYNVTAKYTKGAFLLHPKFGKGIVEGVEGSHVVVLFAEGTKKLGHGRTAQPPRVRPTIDFDALAEAGDGDGDPATADTGNSGPATPPTDSETH